MPINPAIISGASSGSKGVFGVLGSLFSFILKSWKISLPLLAIFFMMFGSIIESIQQKSPEPFVYDFLGTMSSLNHRIGIESQRIIDDGGILVSSDIPETSWWNMPFKISWYHITVWWRTFVSIASLIYYLMLFFWVFYLFYKLAVLITNNQSAITSNLLIMFAFVYALTTIGSLLLIYPQYEKENNIDVPLSVKLNPFTGFIKLGKAIPYLKPVYSANLPSIQDTQELIEQSPINFT